MSNHNRSTINRCVTAFALMLCFALSCLVGYDVVLASEPHQHTHSHDSATDKQDNGNSSDNSQEEHTQCNDPAKCCKLCLHINLKNCNTKVTFSIATLSDSNTATMSAVSESALLKTGFITPVHLKIRLNN
ncbi:MAG: hypothetical protein FWG83_07605 [Oscillospiraceae bacterium]|nr:hypothetical protein [Oscillospiraceae bacterium]